MVMHPWTKYDVARARDDERHLRAMAAYQALRGKDGGAVDLGVESRAGRIRLLDRILRREVGAVRAPVRPAV
jgi:hypothetical protein